MHHGVACFALPRTPRLSPRAGLLCDHSPSDGGPGRKGARAVSAAAAAADDSGGAPPAAAALGSTSAAGADADGAAPAPTVLQSRSARLRAMATASEPHRMAYDVHSSAYSSQ